MPAKKGVPNPKKGDLGERLGQFRNPEIQAKAAATRAKNAALRKKEAIAVLQEELSGKLYSLKEADDVHKAWELYKKVAMEKAAEGDPKHLQWYLDKFVESIGQSEDREERKEQTSFKEAVEITAYKEVDDESEDPEGESETT